MHHQGTKVIETDRLLLRPFRPGDAEHAFRNWCQDPEVTRYLTWPPHADISVTEAVLASWIAEYEKPDFYQWAIELKSLAEPVGSISVVHVSEDTEQVEIGYCIGRSFWHQGITSEALAALISFLFQEVGVNRIQLRHDSRNPHSGGVMKKCGLRYEGTLRQAGHSNSGIGDLCIYALLRSDWEPGKP